MVAAESHIVCQTCLQCLNDELCVPTIRLLVFLMMVASQNTSTSCSLSVATDLTKFDRRLQLIQDFGNAVHACQATDLRGKHVAIIGCGTIGLFFLIAEGMGAQKVIGIEVDDHHIELAEKLGCDLIIKPNLPPKEQPWISDLNWYKRY